MYENRLVSLAAQKFVSDVANDALQHCKMRSAGQTIKNSKNKDRKFVMTMEDLGQALGNQGVTVKKPPYYTWIKYPFVEEYPPVSLFSEIVTTVLAAETIEKSKKFKKGNPVPALAFKFALHTCDLLRSSTTFLPCCLQSNALLKNITDYVYFFFWL